MPADYVFPNNNEEEFIQLAPKLGFDSLIFIYNYGTNTQKIKEKLARLSNKQLSLDFAILALPKYLRKAKQSATNIAVKNIKDNRDIFEHHKHLVIFDIEDTGKKEFIHHRSSGLNHILCRLAKKNGHTLAFSFNLIFRSSPVMRARIIGRMKQNIRLYSKYKVNVLIASFATSPLEMRSYNDLLCLLKL